MLYSRSKLFLVKHLKFIAVNKILTIFVHSHLNTLLKTTCLTLVPVGLVYNAKSRPCLTPKNNMLSINIYLSMPTFNDFNHLWLYTKLTMPVQQKKRKAKSFSQFGMGTSLENDDFKPAIWAQNSPLPPFLVKLSVFHM